MFRFSKISRERLRTCHEDLIILCNEIIKHYDCTVVCGHRSKKEQDEAYNKGYSQLKWPNSKHNIFPSHAVDLVAYESHGLDWGTLQSAYFAGFVMGIANQFYYDGKIKHKIRCGIDWDMDNDINDTKFFDAAHFELIEQ
jgi:peptidoglycan L-alanyl-D-glutamate endopeptidase CwlK